MDCVRSSTGTSGAGPGAVTLGRAVVLIGVGTTTDDRDAATVGGAAAGPGGTVAGAGAGVGAGVVDVVDGEADVAGGAALAAGAAAAPAAAAPMPPCARARPPIIDRMSAVVLQGGHVYTRRTKGRMRSSCWKTVERRLMTTRRAVARSCLLFARWRSMKASCATRLGCRYAL